MNLIYKHNKKCLYFVVLNNSIYSSVCTSLPVAWISPFMHCGSYHFYKRWHHYVISHFYLKVKNLLIMIIRIKKIFVLRKSSYNHPESKQAMLFCISKKLYISLKQIIYSQISLAPVFYSQVFDYPSDDCKHIPQDSCGIWRRVETLPNRQPSIPNLFLNLTCKQSRRVLKNQREW